MKTNVHLFLLYIYGGEIPFYLYLYDKLFLAHVVSDGHADTSSLKNLEGSVDYLYIQFVASMQFQQLGSRVNLYILMWHVISLHYWEK